MIGTLNVFVWLTEEILYQDSFLGMAQGVRQGGVLTPILFSIHVDDVLLKLNEIGLDCHIQGMVISAIMYADDVILLSLSVR